MNTPVERQAVDVTSNKSKPNNKCNHKAVAFASVFLDNIQPEIADPPATVVGHHECTPRLSVFDNGLQQ